MLALATGWTPDVIAGDTGQVSARFRDGAHWALYAKVIAGPEGLPDTSVDMNAPVAVRQQAQGLAIHVAALRKHLYPED